MTPYYVPDGGGDLLSWGLCVLAVLVLLYRPRSVSAAWLRAGLAIVLVVLGVASTAEALAYHCDGQVHWLCEWTGGFLCWCW